MELDTLPIAQRDEDFFNLTWLQLGFDRSARSCREWLHQNLRDENKIFHPYYVHWDTLVGNLRTYASGTLETLVIRMAGLPGDLPFNTEDEWYSAIAKICEVLEFNPGRPKGMGEPDFIICNAEQADRTAQSH